MTPPTPTHGDPRPGRDLVRPPAAVTERDEPVGSDVPLRRGHHPADLITVITVLAISATAAATLLPWFWSGERGRHAFEAVRAARVLGIDDDPLRRAVLLAVLALPAFAGLAWIAAALGRPAVLASTAAATGVCALAAAVVVWSTSLRAGGGAVAASVLGTVDLALAPVVVRRRRKEPR